MRKTLALLMAAMLAGCGDNGMEPLVDAGPADELTQAIQQVVNQDNALDPEVRGGALDWRSAGDDLFKQGAFEEAIEYYGKSLALVPDPKTFYNRGVAYLARNDHALAILDFSETLKLYPGDAAALFNRGLAHGKGGDPSEGIKDLTSVLRLTPEDVQAYLNRGWIHLKLGQLDTALADFDQAIQLDPQCVEGYIDRGYVYHARGEARHAEAERLGSIGDAKLSNSTEQEAQKHYAEAVAEFSKAPKLAPESALAYSNRGNARTRLGKLDDALADLSKAVALDGSNPNIFNNRGSVYAEKGEHAKALADFTKALELQPQLASALRNRGFVHHQMRELIRAQEDFDAAVRLEPATRTLIPAAYRR